MTEYTQCLVVMSVVDDTRTYVTNIDMSVICASCKEVYLDKDAKILDTFNIIDDKNHIWMRENSNDVTIFTTVIWHNPTPHSVHLYLCHDPEYSVACYIMHDGMFDCFKLKFNNNGK